MKAPDDIAKYDKSRERREKDKNDVALQQILDKDGGDVAVVKETVGTESEQTASITTAKAELSDDRNEKFQKFRCAILSSTVNLCVAVKLKRRFLKQHRKF